MQVPFPSHDSSGDQGDIDSAEEGWPGPNPNPEAADPYHYSTVAGDTHSLPRPPPLPPQRRQEQHHTYMNGFKAETRL